MRFLTKTRYINPLLLLFIVSHKNATSSVLEYGTTDGRYRRLQRCWSRMHKSGGVRTGPGLLLAVVRFLQTKFLDTIDDGLKCSETSSLMPMHCHRHFQKADTDASSKSAMTLVGVNSLTRFFRVSETFWYRACDLQLIRTYSTRKAELRLSTKITF